MTARTFNCSYHGLEQQERQKGIPATQLFNCTTGTHLATSLNHCPCSPSHTKELLSSQFNSCNIHSAAHPTLGFFSTWLYNLTIFLKSPVVWKCYPNINPIRSAVMFLLTNQDHVIIKSLLISCANDSQVCVPLSNTLGFILSSPLRYEHEKKDALSALPKCQRQIPSQTKRHQPNQTHKSPRNLCIAGLGWSRSKRKRKASENVQRESESGGSWLGIPVVAKQKESLKRRKGVMLLGNEKEDKQGKFPQTNNCKQKINESIKPYKE